jgi:hypothetical protein
LFNIYLTDKRIEKDPLRQLLFEAIRSYLKITDSKLVNDFLQRSLEKYKLETSDSYTRYSLLDLIAAIVPFIMESQLNVVYHLALDGISVSYRLAVTSLTISSSKLLQGDQSRF